MAYCSLDRNAFPLLYLYLLSGVQWEWFECGVSTIASSQTEHKVKTSDHEASITANFLPPLARTRGNGFLYMDKPLL